MFEGMYIYIYTRPEPLQAAKQNNAYIASKLLMFGARLEQKDFWGHTADSYAGPAHSRALKLCSGIKQLSSLHDPGIYASLSPVQVIELELEVRASNLEPR